MKLRIASIAFVIVALAALPAVGQILVNNGPINGTTDGWTINFGFVVSDSFSLSQASSFPAKDFEPSVDVYDSHAVMRLWY